MHRAVIVNFCNRKFLMILSADDLVIFTSIKYKRSVFLNVLFIYRNNDLRVEKTSRLSYEFKFKKNMLTI